MGSHNHPTNVQWNDDNVGLLRKLHAAGLSCSKIAVQIPMATRNAIIGKLHRLGLTGQGRPKSRKRRKGIGECKVPLHAKSQPLHSAPRVPRTGTFGTVGGVPAPRASGTPYREITVMPVVDDDSPPLHPRPYADLADDMCQWPLYVEQGVQMYCATHINRRDGVYCPAHKALSHQPVKRSTTYGAHGRKR